MAAHIEVTTIETGIARLTLDRADKRNSLSIRVRDEMSDALDALAADESVSVVLLDSVGPVFSAGFDLGEFQNPDIGDELWASSDRWHRTIRTHPTPLVASVQGAAVAGGFDLATMCDLRIAGRSATFRRPELSWGVAIYSVLADLVGGAMARELSMTPRVLTADEAAEIGLVNRVVDDDDLSGAAVDFCREVASCDRGALVHSKAMAIAHARQAADGELGW